MIDRAIEVGREPVNPFADRDPADLLEPIVVPLGVITPQLFTMLVLMAVVTTAATAPLLSRLTVGDPRMSPAAPRPQPAQLGRPEPDDGKPARRTPTRCPRPWGRSP